MASGWQACLIAQRVLLFFYFFPLRGSGAWESGDRHSVIRFSLFSGPGWLSCDCKQSCSTVGRLCGREAVPECVSGSAGRPHLNNPGFSVSTHPCPPWFLRRQCKVSCTASSPSQAAHHCGGAPWGGGLLTGRMAGMAPAGPPDVAVRERVILMERTNSLTCACFCASQYELPFAVS